jgi:hypothetical protein
MSNLDTSHNPVRWVLFPHFKKFRDVMRLAQNLIAFSRGRVQIEGGLCHKVVLFSGRTMLYSFLNPQTYIRSLSKCLLKEEIRTYRDLLTLIVAKCSSFSWNSAQNPAYLHFT